MITSRDGGSLFLDNGKAGIIEALSNAVREGANQAYNLEIFTGNTVFNAGVIETSAHATLGVDDAIDNMGSIVAQFQELYLGAYVGGVGTDRIDRTTLDFAKGVASGQTVSFAADGTLFLGDPEQFHATLSGFAFGDAVDLAGFDDSTLLPFKYHENSAGTGGTLVVDDGKHIVDLDFPG